jgi:hypothetical protein
VRRADGREPARARVGAECKPRSLCERNRLGLPTAAITRRRHPCGGCVRLRLLTVSTSAPGLGSPRPHLHRDSALPCHICTATGLAPATSAPGTRLAVHVSSADQVRRLHAAASANRKTRPTLLNTESSRSHMVYELCVDRGWPCAPTGVVPQYCGG